MSVPNFPEAMPLAELKNILQPLSLWAAKPSAEADLESIFGPRLDWATAFKHLATFRRADFSFLPAIHTLPAADMPGLWGGYSRDTREIYLSADCPRENLSAVLIEEIGHFLDQELCSEETPGEEGTRFAALVLGLPLEAASDDDSLAPVVLEGREILVEAARKSNKSGGRSGRGKKKSQFTYGAGEGTSGGGGGGGTPQPSPSNVPLTSSSPLVSGGSVILPPSQSGNLRIEQKLAGDTLVGSPGNDTFVIFDQNVTINDSYGGTDLVESSVTFSLENLSPIENLLLSGASNINGTGNARANVITGNSGNNVLDGGGDSAIDTLIGGAGNDTYVLRDNLDQIVETVGGGTDTIETTRTTFSLANYANVENLAYSGTGTEMVFTGNSGNNSITGSSGADSLDGGAGVDTLVGGVGNDIYFVDNTSDRVVENASSGKDIVISTADSYVLDANVENLTLAGTDAISGTGNSLANILAGNTAANFLAGVNGNDSIFAGAGDDTLSGGSDNDLLVGDVSAFIEDSAGEQIKVTAFDSTKTESNAAALAQAALNDSSNISITSAKYTGAQKAVGFLKDGVNFGSIRGDEVKLGSGIVLSTGLADTSKKTADANASTSNNTAGSYLVNDILKDVFNPNVQSRDAATLEFSFTVSDPNAKWISMDILFGSEEYPEYINSFPDIAGVFIDGQNAAFFTGDSKYPLSVLAKNVDLGYFLDNSTAEYATVYDGITAPLTLAGSLGGGVNGEHTIKIVIADTNDRNLDSAIFVSNIQAVQSGLFGIRSIQEFGNDSLLGGTGNDILLGNGGNDTLFGEGDNDSLVGGAGADSLVGGTGDDTILGGEGRDVLDGGEGSDVLDGGSGINTLIGGSGDDIYYVGSASELVLEDAGGGTDLIITSDRSITLLTYANIENIVYVGSLDGGGGGGSEILSTLGTDNDDYLFGGSGNDTIIGKAGNDTLEGKAGNDSLDGGAGSDTMSGGIGSDTYVVDTSTDVIQENSNEGTDLVISSVSFTLGANVENLTLNAALAVADANINGTGNATANLITGNKGNNQLDGGGGSDTLTAGAGNDILNGGTADGVGDLLQGGEGNDRYIVDSTLDVIRDSGGTDTVETTVSFNIGDTLSVEGIEHLLYKDNNAAATLKGNNADNSLTSKGTAADRLEAGAGDDTLDGGTGANILIGGTGDDYYIVNSAAETIIEGTETGSGLDTVLTKVATFALGADSNVEILTYNPVGTSKTNLTGSNSDNTITGGNFGNSLSGLGGNDYLIGGVLGDTLVGGDGDDTLDGKAGVNSLVGGAGDDYYITDSQSVNLVENLNEGKDTVRSTVNFSLEYSGKLANVEGLYLAGTANLTGTGNSLDNTLTGTDGNNTLSGKLGNDTILGGLGADYIKGDEGNDSIVGGGDIQGDVPADASTPILLASGQTYTGQIGSRNETDWIRVDLKVGVTYTFAIDSQLVGAQVLKDRSDVAFGAQGSDQYWGWGDGVPGYSLPPLIGDISKSGALINQTPWSGNLADHDELVLNADGTVAYGYFDPKQITKSTKYSNNIVGFQFTPFESGTFYVPVSGAGPALGSYRLTLTDPESPATGAPALADNASNTLLGGVGADTLVAGNGRDAQGKAIGDILLGGTNGLLGQVDTDSSGDTLIGGDGNDSLDGGNGANSLVGGKGDDYYYIRSQSDIVIEQIDGGTGDAMIVNFAAKLAGEWDIVLDPDYVEPNAKPVFQFANIENVTLTGSAHTSVLGSSNSDKIVGNFGNNTFAGGAGDDTLLGMGGNDSLIGGEGADSLDGGSGVSTLDGGLGSDTYIVNDRNDRIINEIAGLDGGKDYVRTYFNFDPIQGDGVVQFDPGVADNSPSVTKSQSFASQDLESFYNLENFELLGGAVYGVGNALANSITAGPTSTVLYGMGGEDTVLGGAGDDTLYGDTPDFYALPDLYASAPKDTQTQAFLNGVIGQAASDYLDGGAGDDYLDGGRGFDTMIGGAGNDTFVQDNVDDYIVAGGGANELISSVNIAQAPDGISKLMLVVAKQAADSGQSEVASFASFQGAKDGNNLSIGLKAGYLSLSVKNANDLELMYAPREGEVFIDGDLIKGPQEADLANPGKFQYDLSWTAGVNAGTDVVGYVVKYKRTDITGDIWHTYVKGKSQDFQGSRTNPTLTVTNLDDGTYDFQVTAIERTIPALQDRSAAQHVTLQGGAGNDAVFGTRLTRGLPGAQGFNVVKELGDALTDPLLQNFQTPVGFIFNPAPYDRQVGIPTSFASYLDGGYGNDLLMGESVNDLSGDDYVFQGVTFKGLNTLVGGQGSDTFVVTNGGNAIGDEFDWVVKYGNETPIVTLSGDVGSSLNGGQHNLVVSAVSYLTLSDELVNQGKFIDQLGLAGAQQFGMGNRLDNYIYDAKPPAGSNLNTLVGNAGRDSIVSASKGDVLIGGTAYGLDQVGLAIRDFASVADGGNGLKNSIFRDTDPIPVGLNGPGAADPSQFWFVPGYYGEAYDPARNRDTLIAGAVKTTLDGGAGADSLVGSGSGDDDDVASASGDMFIVSQGSGGEFSKNILFGDAVIGNGGNDTVTFTDSDYLWWGGHQENAVLEMHDYTIAADISNLVLQTGAPTARNATGNSKSTANDHKDWFAEIGSNRIIGNEFDNILDGGGVGKVGGFDTLTGGAGSDYFAISGYTGASNNKWEPSITDYKDGSLAGNSEWDITKSEYTDADFVVITDFTPDQDFLSLTKAADYWIGVAPTGYKVDNVRPSTGALLPDANATNFGIYKAGTYGSKTGAPDLIAQIQLAGGITLDTASLVLVTTPPNTPAQPGTLVPTGTKSDVLLGWGSFWKMDGALFSNGSNFNDQLETQANFVNTIQTPSTASLSDLMAKIV